MRGTLRVSSGCRRPNHHRFAVRLPVYPSLTHTAQHDRFSQNNSLRRLTLETCTTTHRTTFGTLTLRPSCLANSGQLSQLPQVPIFGCE